MRIYVPAAAGDLQNSPISARTCFGVNDPLRAQFPEEDEEGLEYLAFLAAAEASLDEGEISRIVLAADAAATSTSDPGVVHAPEVPWSDVVSIHIDDVADPALLADISAAQAGDQDARARVGQADLLWYDASERAVVLQLLAAI